MSRAKAQTKQSSYISRDSSRSYFLAVFVSMLLVFVICSLTETLPSFQNMISTTGADTCNGEPPAVNRTHDPKEATFYDEPELTYTLGKTIEDWDKKRKSWLHLHPSFAAGADTRILIVTGSQPSPCKNPTGDHLLLRCFKNKADYSRIHGYDIFYNTACLDPKLCNVWAKVALIRAAMVAHPEAEWIWWMDSDAVFTDMYFKVPLQRYKQHNLVVPGWPDMVYEKKSWVSLNTGSFFTRNCQWSLDFLDVWARMSPRSPDYKFWSETLMSTLSDKMFPGADEQSSLVYLLLTEKKKWGDKIYLENQYDLSAYWVGVVGKLDKFTRTEADAGKNLPLLRRRRAEVVSESVGEVWEKYLENNTAGEGKRPFITHFTGCQPCSGNHDPSYVGNTCWDAMERTLNYADNQVLRNLGFVHRDISHGSYVSPLAFDFPSEVLQRKKSGEEYNR
ncbi:glycosyltransferase 6-like [Coffea eugenioides]|uniref:glycosyltransferase 6-like n=1 Tax=Coffea eugenioides TaxID=49369 RepID=UPI000F607B8F|nr:glycosyltransferase 6-like [Coffea eugenioides]